MPEMIGGLHDARIVSDTVLAWRVQQVSRFPLFAKLLGTDRAFAFQGVSS